MGSYTNIEPFTREEQAEYDARKREEERRRGKLVSTAVAHPFSAEHIDRLCLVIDTRSDYGLDLLGVIIDKLKEAELIE